MLERSKNHSANTNKVKPLTERRDICCVIELRLEISFQLINFFVGLLVIYLLVLGWSQLIVVFKEVPFIMMPLLV